MSRLHRGTGAAIIVHGNVVFSNNDMLDIIAIWGSVC